MRRASGSVGLSCQKQTATVCLRRGTTVELECTVSGHAEAGMRATMVMAEGRR